MIARQWKCRCPKDRKESFVAYLYDTGVKEASVLPGYLGVQILCRDIQDKAEIVLTTYWDKLESVTAFAGEDIHVAKLYPEDHRFGLDPELRVQHYQVIECKINPGSAPTEA